MNFPFSVPIPPSSLLYPHVRSLANRLRRLDRRGRGWVAAATILVIAVWVGLFFGIRFLVEVCYGIELFGEFLVDRLLSLFLLSFFGILLFSNVVSSLATFYLSDDLAMVNAAPIDPLRFFYARLAQTVATSSWMVLLFGLPVLFAYGTVHGSGSSFYLLAAAVLPAYFLIPASVSVVVTTVLVNVFPARRARDLLVILSGVFLAGVFLLIRAIRPERLVDPNAFSTLAEFIGELSMPQEEWFPSTWASRALTLAMRGRGGSLIPATNLLLTAGAAVFSAAWIVSAAYFSGWSKAQEGRRAHLHRFRGEWLARMAARLLGPRGGAVLAKDARVFFRDAGQWSQLLLLLALIAIYLLSIHALPFDALDFPTATYRNAVAFLNLGMSGFVLAAVAARFLYPAVSVEGRGIWILRASPMGARELVRAKFGAGILPLALLGQVISIASNVLLRSTTLVMVAGSLTTLVIAATVCALAVGYGARMPDFKAENAAKVAAGFGGLVYMASALAYLGAVVALEAYPTYRLYDAALYGYALSGSQWAICIASYALVLLVSAAVAGESLRRGAAALEAREYT